MNFLQSLAEQFAGKPIDWDELEESLIRADLGVLMTTRIIKTLQEREAWSLLGISDVIKAVRQEIGRILPTNPAPIQCRPGCDLLRGVSGGGQAQDRLFALRYGRSPTHESESDGRVAKGETHPRQTRPGRAARDAAGGGCNDWRQRAQSGARIPERHRRHWSHRYQTRRQRQRGNCGCDSG